MICVALALLTTVCVAANATEYPVSVLEAVPRSKPYDGAPTQYVISVDGTRCATMDELKQTILRLAPGSVVTWEVGCFGYRNIPVGPAPQTPKREFKAFCRERGVTFRMTKFTSY